MSGVPEYSKYYIKGPLSNATERNEYADPDLVAERARELADIPFELVSGSVSEDSKTRAERLEKEFRGAGTRRAWPNMKMELRCTILGHPLSGPWPADEPETDDATEYILAKSPEEWFAWKQAQDEHRAQNGVQAAKGQKSLPVGGKQAAKPSAPGNNKLKILRSDQIVKTTISKRRSAKREVNQALEQFATGHITHTLCLDENDNLIEIQLRTRVDSPSRSHSPSQRPASRSKSTKNSSQNTLEQTSGLPSRSSSFSRISRSSSASKYPPQNMGLMTPVSSTMSRSQSTTRWAGSRTPVKGSVKGSQQDSSQREGAERPSQLNQVPLQPRIERVSTRNSLQLSQVESNFQSPTTTDYLYGSQRSNQPVSSAKQPDSYIDQLEEETRRIDAQRRTGPQSTMRTSRHNTWHLHSNDDEDTHFQSQQARDISNIVGEDLGEFHRDENYEALRYEPQRYTDPYDVAY